MQRKNAILFLRHVYHQTTRNKGCIRQVLFHTMSKLDLDSLVNKVVCSSYFSISVVVLSCYFSIYYHKCIILISGLVRNVLFK